MIHLKRPQSCAVDSSVFYRAELFCLLEIVPKPNAASSHCCSTAISKGCGLVVELAPIDVVVVVAFVGRVVKLKQLLPRWVTQIFGIVILEIMEKEVVSVESVLRDLVL